MCQALQGYKRPCFSFFSSSSCGNLMFNQKDVQLKKMEVQFNTYLRGCLAKAQLQSLRGKRKFTELQALSTELKQKLRGIQGCLQGAAAALSMEAPRMLGLISLRKMLLSQCCCSETNTENITWGKSRNELWLQDREALLKTSWQDSQLS